ncbi:sensor histidine kinase [Pigmentiphaga sp. NML080357]|uniref:sensor histidine kinase n=1 Tax=Pigmentiphaga sp. NML080357 TaxID=2008675 RepID=UPI001303ADB3|nr:sensor histidine kinase [Pigmentiphaga sp. NML080357]
MPPKDDSSPSQDTTSSPHDEDDAALHSMRLRELHHSVHNGLNLISSALQVQARRSGNAEVRRELGIAVSRIESLVRLHEHAYQHEPARAPNASEHFEKLARQLQAALVDPRSARLLAFTCDAEFQLEAGMLVSLGSVLIELVTNAIKYGKGDVRISLHPGPASITMAIEDDGDGFPVPFDIPRDAGFGLRLVSRVCANSGGTLSIDRTVPFTRVVAVIGLRA